MQRTSHLLIAALVFGTASCSTPNATDSTQQFVDSCAVSNLNSKSVLYFGPSNQIGPGSVWSRLGDAGGYQPQWRMQDLGVDTQVIAPGQRFTCDLTNNSKLTASAALSVISSVAGASADTSADFSRGKVVNISSTGAAWDSVVAGPYNLKLKAIADPGIRADIAGPNRIVLIRALRLDGYRVTLDFDASVKPAIKAKYSGNIIGKDVVGDVGANFAAAWTSDDKLQLTAADGVYVAGEFAQLVNGEWVGTRGSGAITNLGDTWVQPYTAKR
jgi:hypothetical protein